MKITSVFEYMQWIEKHSREGIYRGHLKEEWILTPSIVRYYEQSDKCIIDDKTFIDIDYVEYQLTTEFVKYSVPYKDFRSTTYLEKLIDAQHFGLPTRLLDCTTNPLKGLFFAVENPDFDAFNGAVYWIEPDAWYAYWVEDIVSDRENEVAMFFPASSNERLSAQEGCFIAFPLTKKIAVTKKEASVLPLTIKNYPDNIKSLEKIEVEAKSKKQIRIELDKLGVNHRTLFPGLDGVARWIKSDYSKFRE